MTRMHNTTQLQLIFQYIYLVIFFFLILKNVGGKCGCFRYNNLYHNKIIQLISNISLYSAGEKSWEQRLFLILFFSIFPLVKPPSVLIAKVKLYAAT